MLIFDATILKDAIHNLHPSVANTPEKIVYGKGVLIGLVSGIMATGRSFATAAAVLSVQADVRKRKIVKECVPEPWIEELTQNGWEF